MLVNSIDLITVIPFKIKEVVQIWFSGCLTNFVYVLVPCFSTVLVSSCLDEGSARFEGSAIYLDLHLKIDLEWNKVSVVFGI